MHHKLARVRVDELAGGTPNYNHQLNFLTVLVAHANNTQGERQEEMQKRRQYTFRVLMRARADKLRDSWLRHRFVVWRVCVCDTRMPITICTASACWFLTFNARMFCIFLIQYGMIKVATREARDFEKQQWMQESAADRCVCAHVRYHHPRFLRQASDI